MIERLHKYMAHCGVASRRKCEAIIREGRVTVDGKVVTELGLKIDPDQHRIKVDGRRLKKTENKVYYMLHKPKDVTTTASDDLGRRTVLDMIPEVKKRVYPVGRLDRDSEGLVVLTNDGDLANYMTHPSFGVMKVYRATVEGQVDPELLKTMTEKGVKVGAALIRPASVRLVKALKTSTIIEVTVGEGINREVRRLFAALGHEVKKLIRIKEGPLSLRGLGKGKHRPLTDSELAALRKGMKQAFKGETAPAEQRTRVYDRDAARQGKPDPAKAQPKRKRGARKPKSDKSPGPAAPASTSKPDTARRKKKPPADKGPRHPLSGS